MKRRRWFVLAVIALASAATPRPVRADEGFLGALSRLATREARKQLADKRIAFAMGPFKGHVVAVEPERYLEATVKDFELADDLLKSTATAAGRFRVEGKVNGDSDISGTFDVKLGVVAEVRFTKEGDKYFAEPTIKDMTMNLAILEISRSDLEGAEELLSNLATAAFAKNKDQIIAETNKRLGKRPF